jgi:hypothetical protein
MIASAHHQDRGNGIQRRLEGRRATGAARLVLILGVGVAAVGSSSPLLGSSALAGPPVAPFPAQDQEDGDIVRVKAVTPLSRCLATWNNTSGMSKREWAQTCKRVVKQNPGLYSKPF